ncbi:MAG: TrmH family RNA methyltransferase [Treponema sp.]
MIELFKLAQLPSRQKIHKIIKILELLEAECAACEDKPLCVSYDAFYIEGLLQLIAAQYEQVPLITEPITRFFAEKDLYTSVEYRVLCNTLRHALYQQTDITPSEWDLIMPGTRYGTAALPHEREAYSVDTTVVRPFFSGVYAYIEDIRAPFNLGSLFRTAEAFGVEKFFLSKHCVSPEHSRAQRSSMGCTEFLPWAYGSLETLPADIPIFALETGGTAITSFTFPQKGIVLVGSEELGLSTAALRRASAGVVSIPMTGIKASLNVAVAFGILMQYWTSRIALQCG